MEALTEEEITCNPLVTHEEIDKTVLRCLIIQFACVNDGRCLGSTMRDHFEDHPLREKYNNDWFVTQMRKIIADNFILSKYEQRTSTRDVWLVLNIH